MKLSEFEYRCEPCGRWFVDVEYTAPDYGTIVYRRDEDGSLALGNLLDCPVLQEISALVESAAICLADPRWDVQELVGMVADTEKGLGGYRANTSPRCPSCGGRSIGEVRETGRVVERDVPPLSFSKWKQLSDADRVNLLAERMQGSGTIE